MGGSVLENFRQAQAALLSRREELRTIIEVSTSELREIEATIATRPGDSRPLRERLIEFLIDNPGAIESDIGNALSISAVHLLAPMIRKGQLRADGSSGERARYRYFVVTK